MPATTDQTQQARYLSLAGAAAWASVSIQTLRRWLTAERLRAYRPAGSRKVLIDRNELEQVIRGEE
jgi:excisionase family DNA binding protein